MPGSIARGFKNESGDIPRRSIGYQQQQSEIVFYGGQKSLDCWHKLT
jgi:hypothetical protein